MQTYEIKTLPHVEFAHVHHAATYLNTFPQRENAMEITYISEGEITVTYHGSEYVASKGDIVCLPYDQTQICIRANAYHAHHTVLARLTWTIQGDGNGLYLPIVTPAQLDVCAAANIIDELIGNQLIFKTSPTKGATMFLGLLYEIDRCNRRQKKLPLPGEALYTLRAKEYVQGRLHAPITQKSVAAHLGISPEYLCAVFKKTQGISFMKYVNTEKLEGIRVLMAKEGVRLYEAAALFGYSDPNYVSRLFKKYYGYTITDPKNRAPEA